MDTAHASVWVVMGRKCARGCVYAHMHGARLVLERATCLGRMFKYLHTSLCDTPFTPFLCHHIFRNLYIIQPSFFCSTVESSAEELGGRRLHSLPCAVLSCSSGELVKKEKQKIRLSSDSEEG